MAAPDLPVLAYRLWTFGLIQGSVKAPTVVAQMTWQEAF